MKTLIHPVRCRLAALLPVLLVCARLHAAEVSDVAQITTSLPMKANHEPELAFDGKLDTFFQADAPPREGDDFTVRLPKPTRLNGIEALTGLADGTRQLEAGVLETSTDGTNFVVAATFAKGEAKATGPKENILAVRIRATAAGNAKVVIRELKLDSATPLPLFHFVTRVDLDYSKAPECAEFALRSKALVEEWYPRIRELLASTNQAPPNSVVTLIFRPMDGVAATSADVISVSSGYVKNYPNDYGMIIHELTHVVQGYKGGGKGWCTEGIADYIRHCYFEPGARKLRINPDKAKYTDAYTTTAAFFIWLEKNKDAKIVSKLNAASRGNEPLLPIFKEATGSDVNDLWKEFADTFRTPKPDAPAAAATTTTISPTAPSKGGN